MSTFVYVGWVGGQCHVYVDIFSSYMATRLKTLESKLPSIRKEPKTPQKSNEPKSKGSSRTKGPKCDRVPI